ncbi:MAG: phosphatase PAP2 family protein [Oligoflexales bacterium]
MLAELTKFDIACFEIINTGLGSTSFDGVMRFFSDEKIWIACSILLLIYAFIRKSAVLKKFCAVLAIAVLISDMVCFRVLKPWFKRQRPCYQLENVRLVSDSCGSEFGFPSNHAANGFAIAVSLHWFVRQRWILTLYPLAIFVGITRVYLGVHFPFDVLFGFFVGLASGLLAVQVFAGLELLYGRLLKSS